MDVDKQAYREFQSRHEGQGLETLNSRLTEVDAKMQLAFDQAGPDIDFSKINSTVISGQSTSDRLHAFSRLHAEQSSLIDSIRQKEHLKKLADDISQRKETGEATEAGALGAPAPGLETGMAPSAFGVAGSRTIAQSANWHDKLVEENMDALYSHGEMDGHKWRKGEASAFSYRNFDVSDIQASLMRADYGAANPRGHEPEATRSGLLVDLITRPVQISDLFPTQSTTQPAYIYMEETYVGSNTVNNPTAGVAAERNEGAEAAEARIELRQRSAPISSIAVWIPVTEEQLDDVPTVRTYLRRKLPFLVRQRLDYQLFNGDGTSPNLEGLLAASRSGLQTHAVGRELSIKAVRRAMTKVRVDGRAVPGPLVMHSSDWQEVSLLQAADGTFLYGHPAREVTGRIWGRPVVEQEVGPEGTAVIGDFQNYAALINRKGMTVDITDSHSDHFIKMTYALRARIRAGIVITRPQAFCKITGL